MISSLELLHTDITAFFNHDVSLEVEIGCGKGKFLLECAAENPGVNFLGIDRVAKWMKTGAQKGEKRNLTNLKFLKAEIRELLQQFPEESVSVFHVYFPDPWPKRRHWKRRLVNASFLELLHSRLKPGALVEIATDHSDYFTEIRKAAAQTEVLWKNIRESVGERLRNEMIRTNYELKFQTAGKKIYYLELQRK